MGSYEEEADDWSLPWFWAATSIPQVSGELTTSCSPGTSFEFALSFVEWMFGSSEIRASLMMHADGRHPREEEFNPVEWFVDRTPQGGIIVSERLHKSKVLKKLLKEQE